MRPSLNMTKYIVSGRRFRHMKWRDDSNEGTEILCRIDESIVAHAF